MNGGDTEEEGGGGVRSDVKEGGEHAPTREHARFPQHCCDSGAAAPDSEFKVSVKATKRVEKRLKAQ